MATDPKFVRLTSRLRHGIRADVRGSGWSIAGLDVKEFPSDPTAAAFARMELNAGRLEPASKAEFEEAHPEEDEVAETVSRFRDNLGAGAKGHRPWQESAVQEAAARQRAKLEEARASESEDDEEEEEWEGQARRKALLDEQKESGLVTDDPAEQVGRSTGVRNAKKAPVKKKAASSVPEGAGQ